MSLTFDNARFLCLMVYQPSWVIYFQSHSCKKKTVVLLSKTKPGIIGCHIFTRRSESEHNNVTGIQTGLMKRRIPAHQPLHNGTPPQHLWQWVTVDVLFFSTIVFTYFYFYFDVFIFKPRSNFILTSFSLLFWECPYQKCSFENVSFKKCSFENVPIKNVNLRMSLSKNALLRMSLSKNVLLRMSLSKMFIWECPFQNALLRMSLSKNVPLRMSLLKMLFWECLFQKMLLWDCLFQKMFIWEYPYQNSCEEKRKEKVNLYKSRNHTFFALFHTTKFLLRFMYCIHWFIFNSIF